jgi:hypothetical protein
MKFSTVTTYVFIFLFSIFVSPTPSQSYFGGGTPFQNQRVSRIPFKLNGHKIYIEVLINNSSRPYWFILDTGAFTSIGESVREACNFSKGRPLKASGSIKYAYSVPESVTLQVGQLGVRDFRLVCMDYAHFYQTDPNMQGFLGSDFLKFFYVKLDYRNRELTLSQDPLPIHNTSQKFILFMNTNNSAHLPRIQCEVDNRWNWSGLIDTGAPHAIVFPMNALSQQRKTGQPIIESDGIMLSWPTSSLDKNYLSRVDRLEMGNLEINDFPVVFANTEDIILGESFLSQYEIYLNYPKNEIILIPYGTVNWKNNFFSVGIKLKKTADNRTIIDAIWKGSEAEKAGLGTGTEIIKINRKNTRGMGSEEWVNLLNNDRIHTIELVVKQGYRQKTYQLKKAPLLPVN